MHTFAQKPNAAQRATSTKSSKPGRAFFSHNRDVHSILHLQRMVGNQAVLRSPQTAIEHLNAGSTGNAPTDFAHDSNQIPVHTSAQRSIRPKLKMGSPGDKYEQEADHVADQVMRMPEPQRQRTCSCGGACPRCTNENQGSKALRIQKLEASSAGETEVPPCINEVLRSPGQPLDPVARAFFEPRFGCDLGQVRLHTDSHAEEAATSIKARAFTSGTNVVFGSGEYQPQSSKGKRLLAHELTHVAQQTGVTKIAPGVFVQRQDQGQGHVTTAEFNLEIQKGDHKRLVNRLYQRYINTLQDNKNNARNATQRFINFEESAIDQLKTVGTTGSGVAYLFGTPGAVVALCIIVLTEVSAQQLSGKSAKIAAASAKLDKKYKNARKEITLRRESIDSLIDSTTSQNFSQWAPIWNKIANLGMPLAVSENIIYRDLLLEYARKGGYNISGSQWNVDNMSLFGKAPWYHSWDWGSPGWTNGRDIADELNALAKGDPSTRKGVSIN